MLILCEERVMEFLLCVCDTIRSIGVCTFHFTAEDDDDNDNELGQSEIIPNTTRFWVIGENNSDEE